MRANIGIHTQPISFIGLPVVAAATGSTLWQLVEGFYRAGSLVFGGGHVVLPLLQAEVVGPGWVTPDAFVAGFSFPVKIPERAIV